MGLVGDTKSGGSDGKEGGKDGGSDTHRHIDARQSALMFQEDNELFIF